MQTFGGEMHEDGRERRAHLSGRLPCMLPTAEMRTAYWHLGEETLMRHMTTVVQRSGPGALRQAAERYGIAEGKHQLIPGLPLQEQARAMHGVGKRILEVDGSHHSFAWLYRDGAQVAILLVDFEDQQDKVVMVRRIAKEVQNTGADAALFTSEIWLARELAA